MGALEAEGGGDDRDGEDAEVVAQSGDDGGGARARPASHAGRDEDHVGVLDARLDGFAGLLGGKAAGVGVGAASQSGREVRPYLQPGRGERRREVLRVRVQRQEVDPGQSAGDHVVDGVGPRSAHADDHDLGGELVNVHGGPGVGIAVGVGRVVGAVVGRRRPGVRALRSGGGGVGLRAGGEILFLRNRSRIDFLDGGAAVPRRRGGGGSVRRLVVLGGAADAADDIFEIADAPLRAAPNFVARGDGVGVRILLRLQRFDRPPLQAIRKVPPLLPPFLTIVVLRSSR
mmetsp:Transcript_56004/g.119084  ORF Transcript_56004/g.119084 Transcript_56004/m.119084 type:complete len:287 (+) Transcript_56004:836-1696(+)